MTSSAGVRRRLDFNHHADLDDLLGGNMEEGTRVLGIVGS